MVLDLNGMNANDSLFLFCRIAQLQAQHEAERQEDKLQMEEQQKRINELQEKLDLKAQETEQKLEQQRKVCH